MRIMPKQIDIFPMSPSAELYCVPPDLVDEMWPNVEGFFCRAIERCGDWTLPDLRTELRRGGLLWITTDGSDVIAAAITKIENVARGAVCNVIGCGGAKSVPWGEAIASIERYAAAAGCVSVRVQGRPGWARILREYAVEFVSIEKRLR